ncbi:uncharacterized protein [Euwallacea similis]|uniref:uncharacterized protein n=1 Tax=Euwallacea similis TaxID=1736056 RepID=UPI00344FA739
MCLHGNLEHGDEFFVTMKKTRSIVNIYCQFCGKLEPHVDKLRNHIQTTHGGVSFTCPSCPNRKFRVPRNLFSHRRLESLVNNVELICPQCALHFYEPISFKEHMTLIHKMEQSDFYYQCILCPEKINDDLESHVHKHGIFYNPTAACTYDGRIALENGRPTINIYKKQCLVCAKLVIGKKLYVHFLKSHMRENKCTICHLKFETLSLLKLHLQKYNISSMYMPVDRTEELPLGKLILQGKRKIDPLKRDMEECWTCFSLLNINQLENHIMSHKEKGTKVYLKPHGKKKKHSTYNCVICGDCKLKVFNIGPHLAVHRAERERSKNQTNPSDSHSSSKLDTFGLDRHHSVDYPTKMFYDRLIPCKNDKSSLEHSVYPQKEKDFNRKKMSKIQDMKCGDCTQQTNSLVVKGELNLFPLNDSNSSSKDLLDNQSSLKFCDGEGHSSRLSERFSSELSQDRSVSKDLFDTTHDNLSSHKMSYSSLEGRFQSPKRGKYVRNSDSFSLKFRFQPPDRSPSRNDLIWRDFDPTPNFKCAYCSNVFDSLEQKESHIKVQHIAFPQQVQLFTNQIMVGLNQNTTMHPQGFQQVMDLRLAQARSLGPVQPFGPIQQRGSRHYVNPWKQ